MVTAALTFAAILLLLGFPLLLLTIALPLLLSLVKLIEHAWHLDFGLARTFDVAGLGLEFVAAAR